MKIDDVAKIAHEVNRAYCHAIGDDSQPQWEKAPAWQRDSAMQGVLFLLKNPDTPPSVSHEQWLKQKMVDGWSWGPYKDPVDKKHPCMLPYGQLPAMQQVKDFLFTAIVGQLAPYVDLSE